MKKPRKQSKRKPESPGGQGAPPSRSEMQLVRRAIRQDWPVTLTTQRKLLRELVGYFKKPKDGVVVKPRVKIAAARTIGALCGLALKQQALDLQREKIDGKKSDVSLSDLVAEAEARAEARRDERDK